MRLQKIPKEILCTLFQRKSLEVPVSIPPSHVLFYFIFWVSHSMPVLLKKYLQHVYSDSSRARFYNLSVQHGNHFIFTFGRLPIWLYFTISVLSYVFTAFAFILHIV